MIKLPKVQRKKMIFDYLRDLKNPVTAEHVGEKFKITARRAGQLLDELVIDDLVVKSKSDKQHWKKTTVNCYAVKDEHRTYKKREPKVIRTWHNPFNLKTI